MADDKNVYDDEYQFTDLDSTEPNRIETNTTEQSAVQKWPQSSNLKRNAIVAVVVLVLVILGAKFLGSMFSKPQRQAINPVPSESEPPMQTASPLPKTVSTPPIITPEINKMTQRLSDIEARQDSLNSQVASLTSQLSTLSSGMNDISTKLTELNQTFTVLSQQVQQQSRELAILTTKNKPKVTRHVVRKASGVLSRYSLQAIIPGRAWLMAENGLTITVREGSQIPGYGVVKLIDSKDGRIITSSGKVIKFSQQDS